MKSVRNGIRFWKEHLDGIWRNSHSGGFGSNAQTTQKNEDESQIFPKEETRIRMETGYVMRVCSIQTKETIGDIVCWLRCAWNSREFFFSFLTSLSIQTKFWNPFAPSSSAQMAWKECLSVSNLSDVSNQHPKCEHEGDSLRRKEERRWFPF